MKKLFLIPGIFYFLWLLLPINQSKSAEHRYIEDFTTTQYKDALNTTAHWDTVSGELKLYPFEITLVGNYNTPGIARGVAISGDYAYVGDGTSGLQVINISDPTNPISAGSYNTPGLAVGVVISGDYAYIGDGTAGLQVVNISNPNIPTLAGSYDTPSYSVGVAVSGDYAYVADSSSLQVIDISDPTNPTPAGSYGTPDRALNVAISGNFAYVADANSGLQVINITDPTNPTFGGSYDTPGLAWSLAISGDYVYVADYTSLQVIDISDPTSPVFTSSYDTPGIAINVFIDGDNVYVADDAFGLQVIDISDPTNPISAGSYDTPGNVYGVVISGEYAYVADADAGLQVVKIAEPILPPLFSGNYNTPIGAISVIISGDHAFVADYMSGLQVIDISDPTNPIYAGSYDTPGFAWDVAISGDYAYVADRDSGLQVIDISDPTNPAFGGSYMTSNDAFGVVIAGDYAYIAGYTTGLQVIDISDPTNPVFAGSYDTPGISYDIAISGDHVYIADQTYGLQVIDISDPTNPIYAGSYNTPGYAIGVAIYGDYAYVADHESGLQVINISDPTNPTFSGSLDTPGQAQGIAISGNYAFIADRDSGLHVIDISDPNNPILAESYDTPGVAYGAAVSGNYLYIADYIPGLQVFEVFQNHFILHNNIGQSLILSDTLENITKARLTTIQSDSISWDLSSNNGTNWETVTPNSWYKFNTTGNQLTWRSTHTYPGRGINPTCSHLEIEWLYNFSLIDSIKDVPDDQGGWVRIYFTRSGLDFSDESNYPITGYNIFRRINDINLQNRILAQGQLIEEPKEKILMNHKKSMTIPNKVTYSHIYTLEGRSFLFSTALMPEDPPPGFWEVVSWVSAHQQDQYVALVPALADSGSTLNYSVYCISAETTTPSVYYFSPQDSGYSIDNLIPSTPSGLSASLVGASVQLIWEHLPDNDFRYYAIYRSTEGGFIPESENLLTTTVDTVYNDYQVSGDTTYYYRLSAFDFAGNESEYSDEVSCFFTGISNYDNEIPTTFALYQNYPNPFNPSTTIKFDIPEAGCVKLQIFNSIGEEIQTLISGEMVPGRYTYTWYAAHLASGIYFYKLQSGENFIQIRKMILLR